MTEQELQQLGLQEYEWFDNSACDYLQGCERKGFYQDIGPDGIPLALDVGDAADCGKVFHFGLETFYRKWKPFHEENETEYKVRYANAIRGAYKYWPTLFQPDKRPITGEGSIDAKHQQENICVLLDGYFNAYREPDRHFRIIAAELGVAVLIKPEPGDPPIFKIPFWYFSKCDRFLQRIADGSCGILETKTNGSNSIDTIRKNMELLRFNRQTIGYTHNMIRAAAKYWPGIEVSFFMPDITMISTTQVEFCRDTYDVKPYQIHDWRFQTIELIERWRAKKAFWSRDDIHNSPDFFNYILQDTTECNKWGSFCPYYNLCKHGPRSPSLSDYRPADWHPFNDMAKEEILIVT